MIAEIEAAKKDGDTLGGVVEVVALGLPVGLGSFTSGDNRLDSQLAAAVMGIQAIKGVEIGDGFETARRRGSRRPRRDVPRARRRGALDQPRRRPRGRHDQRPAAAGARRDEADLDRAAGAGHRRHGHRRRGRRDPPALRRVRGARRRRGGRDHGGAGAGPRGAGEVRRRLAGRDPPQHRRRTGARSPTASPTGRAQSG